MAFYFSHNKHIKMDDITHNNTSTMGYVYILEVKDIDLPVCKIGMTKRTPQERCNEINKSSTGDFIWAVTHFIAVDNCQKLEALAHKKLASVRQQGREFFNINADTAHAELLSILDNQSDIKAVDITPAHRDITTATHKKKRPASYKKTEYAAPLLQTFTEVLNVKGRPFGQLNQPYFGISDGNQGVQWNLSVSTATDVIKLGVNLEGMKYNNWPIAKALLAEQETPSIEQLKKHLRSPETVFLSLTRDAWQAASRPSIQEQFIAGPALSIAQCNNQQWLNFVTEALTCLNKNANYCGRAQQIVTLVKPPKSGNQSRLMDVSPHLSIWTQVNLNNDMQPNIEHALEQLRPAYQWLNNLTQ